MPRQTGGYIWPKGKGGRESETESETGGLKFKSKIWERVSEFWSDVI